MEKESRRLLDSLAVRTLKSVRAEVGMLSGGQRQTVAIARSMLGEPRMVILDEPTAALGVAQTEQVLQLVGRLRERGLGVILISHNLADVFQVADRDRRAAPGAQRGRVRGHRRPAPGGRRRHHRRRATARRAPAIRRLRPLRRRPPKEASS